MMVSHSLSLVFDDGFPRSCTAVAELFEQYGQRADFAVLGHPQAFLPGLADWSLLDELQDRGHFIHPHGWDHTLLTELPFAEARDNCRRCLDVFRERGFSVHDRIFHYPFNEGSDALNAWLLRHVAGVRVGGSGYNSEADRCRRILHCAAYGPDACDAALLKWLDEGLRRPPNAMLYLLHGVEGEGWGPIALDTLEQILNRASTGMEFSLRPVTSLVRPPNH